MGTNFTNDAADLKHKTELHAKKSMGKRINERLNTISIEKLSDKEIKKIAIASYSYSY